MTRRTVVALGLASGLFALGLAGALAFRLRHGAASPAAEPQQGRGALEPDLLRDARLAAARDDWSQAYALAQTAAATGSLPARVQAEVARQRSAQSGASWRGSAEALGIAPDGSFLVAALGEPGGGSGGEPPGAGRGHSPEARRVVRVIDVGAGTERKRLTVERPVASVSFGSTGGSGQGALLVRLQGGALLVFDLGTFERRAEFDLPEGALAAVSVSEDKVLLADRGLLVAGLSGGPRERLCDDGGDPFIAVELSGPMGLGLRQSGRLETWHLTDHKLVSVAEGLRLPGALGPRIFLTAEGTLVRHAEGKRTVLGAPAAKGRLATSQGRWVATAPAEGGLAPIELWDVAERRRALVLGVPPGGVRALAFTESGRTLAVLGPEGVQTWKLAARADPIQHLRWVPQRALLFAPSGVLAGADDTVFELSTPEGTSGFERRGWLRVQPPPPGASPSVAFSAQGLHVALAAADGTQVAALGPTGSLSFSARVRATGGVALSAEGDRLFVAAGSALQAFEVRTEKPLWSAPLACTAIAWAPAGHLLCSAQPGLLSIDPQTGAPQTTRAAPAGVRALAVSAKGAVALVADSGVTLLGQALGSVASLLPETGPAAQAAFSVEGGLLATASTGGDLLLWDLRGEAPVLLARLPPCAGQPTTLSFSPLGVALAAACAGTPHLTPIPAFIWGDKGEDK